MSVLYAEVPGFYAEVERVADPALRGRIVLVGGDPRKSGTVQSATREALERVRALTRVRAEVPENFEQLAVAFKRARNIAGEASGKVDPSAFEQDAERELYRALGELADGDGSYEERLRALAGLRAPVDRFFDDVLVMAEDARLRENRKALLGEALGLFYRIADISRLGG